MLRNKLALFFGAIQITASQANKKCSPPLSNGFIVFYHCHGIKILYYLTLSPSVLSTPKLPYPPSPHLNCFE